MQIDKAKLLELLNKCANDLYERGMIADAGIFVILRDEIESGTFDIKEEGYQCPECHDVNSSVRWNAATMSKYGEEISEIQENGDATFICPNCGQEVDRCHIKEVPHADDR